MATDGPDLDALFEKLDSCIRNGQHKKAIKASDEGGLAEAMCRSTEQGH